VFVGIRTEAGRGLVGKVVSRSTETALVEFFDAPTLIKPAIPGHDSEMQVWVGPFVGGHK
jgi:hypothetical protein